MKKQLLILVMMLLPIVTSAATVEIDGIWYILKGEIAEVTRNPDTQTKYTGSVEIPASVNYKSTEYSVTSIGQYAFYQCSGLTSVTIPNSVTSIELYAFYQCSGLTSVTIPNSVTIFGECSFRSCSSLTSITIPNSVTSIGSQAFSGCSSLMSLTIPSSVTNIGSQAFSGCSGLTSINVNEGNTTYDSRDNCNAIIYTESNALAVGCMNTTIPNSVTSIRQYAFYGCSGLTSITIPNTITSISGGLGCPNLTSVILNSDVIASKTYDYSTNLKTIFGTQVTEYIIGDDVTSIGDYAFLDCVNLTSVTIGNGVTRIGNRSFSGCSNLATVTLGNSITNIGPSSFWDCTSLASINIPNSVTSIESGAFYNCSALTSITIPNSVTSIESDAFYTCSNLTIVIINSNAIASRTYDYSNNLGSLFGTQAKNFIIGDDVTSIGKCAFAHCTKPTSVTLGKNVTSIGYGAFLSSSGLTSISLPDSLTYIGDDAFYGCSSLTSVTLGNGVTSIGDGTFYKCSGLTSISLPDSLTYIGNKAFYGCSSLTSISIPSSVTKIDDSSFSNCSNLSVFYCLSEEVPDTHSKAFYNTKIKNAVLHVPNKSIHLYKQSSLWSKFGSLEGLYGNKYTLSYTIDGSNYMSQKLWEDEKIFPVEEPTKEGYTFSGWSEIPETMPAHDVTITGTFSINSYKLTYMVNGEVYKSYDVEYSSTITPEAEPTKEGYTFSGWSEIPTTMPAHDVTITGTFTINKYKLTYKIDGEEYKSSDVEYSSAITPEAEPTREGYTFSGWSEIPETMPAHDVTVTGSFTVNKYDLIYMVDGEVYKSYEVDYGTKITPESYPIKEGYTFSGWSWIPSKMPAEDVTITGTFIINKYKLTYKVDGEEYKSIDVEYNSAITPENEPTKEGYTFSGWSEIPGTMPAHDVTITGTFTINSYKLTYMVDGEEYKSTNIEYSSAITPEDEPTKEGYSFSGWSEIPETMPAHDVTITGTFTINSYKLTYMVDGEVYKETMYEYGATITPEPQPEGDYDTFEWTDLPQTMPAHDVVVHASYISGIIGIQKATQSNIRIYSPNGKKLDKLQKGLNIFVLIDGTVKKVVVK